MTFAKLSKIDRLLAYVVVLYVLCLPILWAQTAIKVAEVQSDAGPRTIFAEAAVQERMLFKALESARSAPKSPRGSNGEDL